MNLGVGAYRDDAGKPFVLSCVRKVNIISEFVSSRSFGFVSLGPRISKQKEKGKKKSGVMPSSGVGCGCACCVLILA